MTTPDQRPLVGVAHVVLQTDRMVDDLRAIHKRLTSQGLAPSPIEARPAIDHQVFTVREPAGHVITFFSSHVFGEPT